MQQGADRQKEEYRQGKKVTLVGALANLLLSAFKVFAGVVGNSAAMVADGVHSLSDLATDAAVLLALKFSSQPKDSDHPYGHGKIETFGALAVGLVLVAVAFQMFFSGINALIRGSATQPTYLALIAALVSIVVKEGLYQYTAAVGRKTGQRSLIANAWHHRTDALSSIAALIGIGGAMFGHTYLDRIAAIAVSLFVVQAGARIAWEAFRDLIDTTLDAETIKKIEHVIKNTTGFDSFHELRARRVGSQILVDLHIQVPADTSVAEGHRIAGRLKSRIVNQCTNIGDVLVHVEPNTGCSLRPCLSLEHVNVYERLKERAVDIKGVTSVTNIEINDTELGRIVKMWIDVDESLSIQAAQNVAENVRGRLLETEDLKDAFVMIECPPAFG